jgi:vitamin B12 transporter
MIFPTRHFALRTSVRLTLATLALSSFSIHADEALDTVTVTANRMPSSHVLAPNSVITRADIERLQINDLPSLLSREPGVDVTTNGGLGKPSSIFMRGTNSDHVLILVDGVKWQSATLGSSAIQDFPVEQIERVEIVRGPRSGLYGAEAIGGVIQIFTRKGQKGNITPYFKAGYGSDNTSKAAAGVSGGNDSTTYSLSVNHDETGGIDAYNGGNPDKDGYRNKSIAARVQHQLTDKIDIGANIMRAEGFNEYDSPFDPSLNNDYESETVNQILGVNSKLQLTEKWMVDVNLGESRDESNNLSNGVSTSTFNTRHRFANLSNLIDIADGQTLNIGFDYVVDDVDSSTIYDESSRDNKAAYLSWQGNNNQSSWLVSIRHDDNEAYGNNNTGTAEWGFALNQDLMLTASVGTAFKAPTFNDLYYPGFGNPDLKAEKAKNYGLGLTGQQNWGQWGVHAYQNEVRDLLAYDTNFSLENIAKATIKGIEFDVATQFMGFDLTANASLLDPEDEQTGKVLRRRAERLANIMVDRRWGDLSAGASLKLRSHSYEDAANNNRVSGFGLVDLRVAYDVSPDWSLQANLSNLFDKEYQTVSGYNSLDRTLMVMVSYQP